MIGIPKHIDGLGRVVIPRKIRNRFGLTKDSILYISCDESRILLIPKELTCALCGNSELPHEHIPICAACIRKIKLLK